MILFDSEDEGEDDEKCPRIRLFAEEKASFCKPWRFSLICKVSERKVGFTYLANRLYKFWQKARTMESIDLTNDFYLARFSCKEDFLAALKGGPWMLAEHLVLVARWHPHHDLYNVNVSTITAWVHIPSLPIEYSNNKALLKLGNMVDRALFVDKTTLSARKYARVCVKLDLRKVLLAKHHLKNCIFKIEYEGPHNICFSCGLFGHNKEQCHTNVGEGGQSKDSGEGEEIKHEEQKLTTPEVYEEYWPWMLARMKGLR